MASFTGERVAVLRDGGVVLGLVLGEGGGAGFLALGRLVEGGAEEGVVVGVVGFWWCSSGREAGDVVRWRVRHVVGRWRMWLGRHKGRREGPEWTAIAVGGMQMHWRSKRTMVQ